VNLRAFFFAPLADPPHRQASARVPKDERMSDAFVSLGAVIEFHATFTGNVDCSVLRTDVESEDS